MPLPWIELWIPGMNTITISPLTVSQQHHGKKLSSNSRTRRKSKFWALRQTTNQLRINSRIKDYKIFPQKTRIIMKAVTMIHRMAMPSNLRRRRRISHKPVKLITNLLNLEIICTTILIVVKQIRCKTVYFWKDPSKTKSDLA